MSLFPCTLNSTNQMSQHQNEFPTSQVVRPISCRSPYSRWVDIQIGTVSILFSYGIPVGLDSIAGCFTLQPSTRATAKHLNLWRDRTLHITVSPEVFDSYLLAALQSESQSLRGLTMNAPIEDGELTPSAPSADPEIDQLDSFVVDEEADQNDFEEEDEDEWDEPEDDEDEDDEDDKD